MSVPKYNELYRPFLTAIQDGQVHTIKEVKMAVSHNMGLSEEDLTERISSGQTVFSNRIGWANLPEKGGAYSISYERKICHYTGRAEAASWK